MRYTITIPSIPIAQPRARAVAFRGHARMHDAPKSHQIHTYKAIVRQCVAEKILAPITGAIAISFEFVFPRPESHYGTGKKSDHLKDSSPRWHTKKPDLDNVAKGLKDSLKGVAWNDDSQVVMYGNSSKRYVTGRNEGPHTVLVIEKIES